MASSRGLGRACAESLAREGVDVVINGRTADDVTRACDELRTAHGTNVTGIVGDASVASVHDALLSACPEPDIVLLNGEGPPPTPFNRIDETMWADTVQRTMVSPLLFVQRVIGGMQTRGFGRIVAISSAMVKSPNPLMSMSHGPRLGLTGVLERSFEVGGRSQRHDQHTAAGAIRHRASATDGQAGHVAEGHHLRRGASRADRDNQGGPTRKASRSSATRSRSCAPRRRAT